MGELHLEVLVDRLQREFNVNANVGRPQVAYRETIAQEIREVDDRHVKQTGGHGQYGHVVIDLEPTPGGGYEFVDHTKGGAVPREYISAVDDGIEEALDAGVLAGYPMVDVRAILVDGSSHAVDSSEMAFKIAGSMALQEAARRAGRPAARAGDGRRSGDPRRVHGRRHRRPQRPSRPDRRDGSARVHPRDPGDDPACRDVRLRHRPAFSDARAGHATPCNSIRTSRFRNPSPARSWRRSAVNDRGGLKAHG